MSSKMCIILKINSCSFKTKNEFTVSFLRTGSEDREYSFAEVCFFFFFFAEKNVIWGQNIFFQIRLKKQMAPRPSFFDILPSFGVKNVCALFREIE